MTLVKAKGYGNVQNVQVSREKNKNKTKQVLSKVYHTNTFGSIYSTEGYQVLKIMKSYVYVSCMYV